MRAHTTEIPELLGLEPVRHTDNRGFLSEVYNEKTLKDLGIDARFVQENHTLSTRQGTIRGLHFQIPPHPAAKLVRVVAGAVFDVAVDLRTDSPTYGQHVSAVLSARNWHQLYIPEGFAHGFCTLEPQTEVVYLTTAHWASGVDRGLRWDDPALAIDWPVAQEQAIVSDKDRSQPLLADIDSYF